MMTLVPRRPGNCVRVWVRVYTPSHFEPAHQSPSGLVQHAAASPCLGKCRVTTSPARLLQLARPTRTPAPILCSHEQVCNAEKIRIKLKSFDLVELNETCDAIKSIASETGATLSGPVPLPLRKRVRADDRLARPRANNPAPSLTTAAPFRCTVSSGRPT